MLELLSQTGGKPFHDSLRHVALVLRFRKAMPFVGIDDELRFDAERSERVPELE
jgi:hypothetical protein